MSLTRAIWNSIRPGNLLIIVFTMVAIWFVLSQLLGVTLDPKYAAWGMVSLILIAASGNMINDVVDQPCDEQSGKQRNPVGNTISKKNAIWIAITLGLFGLAITLIGILFLQSNVLILLLLAVTLALLWFYSYTLQKIHFLGNFTVAVLCTVPILICSLSYGINPLTFDSSPLIPEKLQLIDDILIFYMSFAFLLTLIREFVKDIEDLEGDASCGLRTLPVAIGLERSRMVLIIGILIAIAIETAALVLIRGSSQLISSSWPLILSNMILPLTIILVQSVHMKTSEQAGRISSLLKITMLFGLSTCLFFAFL
ncbi:MAG: UbiA family prenyltransferase [Flavobacteriales bacterium]|nr:UbiA family prenyltransferase [Flavobacteriales bacterium]